MSRLLVTGASGFLGHAVVDCLHEQRDLAVVAAVRRKINTFPTDVLQRDNLDVGPKTDWGQCFQDVSCIVHLAGATPGSVPAEADMSYFSRVNEEGTLALARQAMAAGVRRFIFVSSIGVNGEVSAEPFTPFDEPAPVSPYARSKDDAERGLRQLLGDSPMELVIIRPPLIYGPGVCGKFYQLLTVVNRRWMLPLGGIRNQRSYIALDNLVDLINVCVDHPRAANRIFLASDGEDISTTDLLVRIGLAMGKPARLVSVSPKLLLIAGRLFGKKSSADSLCCDCQVDSSHTREALAWQPPITVDEGLKRTAEAFLAELPRAELIAGKGSKLLRVLDMLFSLLGLVLGSPVLLVLLVAGYFDTGFPLFRQQRVGRHQRAFTLVKFRTMRPDTASVATHLADTSAVTQLGRFMRKTKLDELPQLWNVLKGDMSLVGPRPGLFNQQELTAAREQHGVFAARPGITGLAQVSNIDMSTPELLAETDRRMLETLTMGRYFKYILRTVTGKGAGDAIRKS